MSTYRRLPDAEFRATHEALIAAYPLDLQLELRAARERWMATNRRLGIA